jgi:hypothetical protein
MPRRKKKPRELTDARALQRLFPKEVRDQMREEAEKARKHAEKRERSHDEE